MRNEEDGMSAKYTSVTSGIVRLVLKCCRTRLCLRPRRHGPGCRWEFSPQGIQRDRVWTIQAVACRRPSQPTVHRPIVKIVEHTKLAMLSLWKGALQEFTGTFPMCPDVSRDVQSLFPRRMIHSQTGTRSCESAIVYVILRRIGGLRRLRAS